MYFSSKKQKKCKRAEDMIIDLDDIDDCEDEDEDENEGMPQLLLDDPELDVLDVFEDLEFKNFYQRNKSVDVEDFVLVNVF